MSNFAKVLGIGNYTAIRSPRSDLVTLKAVGVLPCANYEAQLEKRPERVDPPMWDMVFFTQEICLRAIKPFEVGAYMNAADDGSASTVTVHDATGTVIVPIINEIPQATEGITQSTPDEFRVYARLPAPNVKSAGHVGCVVVPAGSAVLGIYYPTFGPASRQECDTWLSKNCIPESDRGGEVPWPLVSGRTRPQQ